MAQRIYLVTNQSSKSIRLIKASVVSQAIAFAAKQEFEAHVATQDELVDSLNAGMKIDKASVTAENQMEMV
jgi:hypothetical protein